MPNTIRPKIKSALPFWSSMILVILTWSAFFVHGLGFIALFFAGWAGLTLIDLVIGLDTTNNDPLTDEDNLFWHKIITWVWPPLQFLTLFGLLYKYTRGDFSILDQILTFFAVGMINGVIGINYSHELMHQKNRFERNLADFLLAMVLYSHFRSEHLLVHHRYVGTPRDPVTARFGEGFHRYFRRVLPACYKSAFRAERELLARKEKPWHDLQNPFWRYWGLQAILLILAAWIGGWMGVALFFWQALVAVFNLEIVNYVEHYGLTRKHLKNGQYEPVKPHHSWNASHRVSNWLLINLQRHSDHHYKPNRRFPLLQNYSDDQAPQLPYGYPIMTVLAFFPRAWRARMNPRVQKWRDMYYPEITDWAPYNSGKTPMPR